MSGTADHANHNELQTAALDYASKGWKIFPVVPGEKVPLTEHGYKDASNERDTVLRWWAKWPTANVGLALDENTVVIDVDPRNGGVVPDNLPPTLTALTGGGGYHFYYRILLPNASVSNKLRKTLIHGVDIKTVGGYVLLPPSVTTSGYRWVRSDAGIQPIPEWLEKLIEKPVYTPLPPQETDEDDDQRPGTLFNKTADFGKILQEDDWTKVGEGLNEDGTIESFYCRPGKSSGTSATLNYNGTGRLYVFSTNSGLQREGFYSPFEYVTETRYGGDYSRAASDLSIGSTFLQLHNITIPNENKLNTTRDKENDYRFIPAFGEGHFVSDFIQYVSLQTDAPMEYAEAAALSTLAVAGFRCKAALAPYPGGLSNNLYVLLVGPTTVSRKSTVQRIASTIIKAVMPPSVLPNRSTTEALIKALSNRSGVPSLWSPDEFGVTLSQIYSRDFMAGLEEMLLTVYAGDDYVYDRVLDTVTIRSPHLSVLAAATPESLARAGATALDSGLLPRFAIVYPKVMPEPRAVSQAQDLLPMKQNLISRLNNILEWSNNVRDITFTQEALEYLNNAERSLTNGPAARLHTMLYKVAALSAISRQDSSVDLKDATSSAEVVERWSSGVASIIPEMYKHGTDQQFELQLEYVLNELQKAGGSMSRVEIANLLNVTKRRLDEIEATLHDKGKINVDTEKGERHWLLL